MAEFDRLNARQKALLVPNEFDRIYTSAGATGMNAATSEDLTIYYIEVPANKMELWFWMESDRLSNPVFREFYTEREVVAEERRMRYDSTPTGRYMQQFNAMFWKIIALWMARGRLAERPGRHHARGRNGLLRRLLRSE